MTIFVLQRVPASLRGELSRWMIEPHAGVFVGRPSALVREKLWNLIREKARAGAALMAYSADTEQGFALEGYGNTTRSLRDFEGLTLVQI